MTFARGLADLRSAERQTSGPGGEDEPERVAEAVARMGLRYAVVTSVIAMTSRMGRGNFRTHHHGDSRARAGMQVEVLIPDFRGDWNALATVMAVKPDVLNHNMETVPRLYRQVRKGAEYERSLELLRARGRNDSGIAHENRNDAGLGRNA